MPSNTRKDGPLLSAKDQVAQTPDSMKLYLRERFGEMRDMAPVSHTVDSLAPETEWAPRNYVNPPFNKIGDWLAKAVEQHLARGCATVFLVPLRPHRVYFRTHMQHFSFVEYLAEGVAFKGYKKVIPHAMCLLGIGVPPAPASPGLVPFHDFFVHTPEGGTKYTIAGMVDKVKADFDVEAKIEKCLSVHDIPDNNYIVSLIWTNMKRAVHHFPHCSVIVPYQLYRDNFAGCLYNGSLFVVDTSTEPPEGAGYRRVVNAFVNTDYREGKK